MAECGTGSHFNFFDSNCGEFAMYNNMAKEFTNQRGIPVKYLPRRFQKQDLLLGEDVLSHFDSHADVKMYLMNATEYGGSGDLFQKFGITMDDRLTLACQQDDLREKIGQEPMVGDLVYVAFMDKLFEVTHKEHERPAFYMFGGLMVYEFTVKLFDYSGEDMETGIGSIDDLDYEDSNSTDQEEEETLHEFVQVIDFDPNAPFKDL